jgi:acetolactate synthase small subunit
MSADSAPKDHLLALRVENKAGVLVRIAGLFARRGFNIISLAVAPSDDERFSRVSIVVDAESAPLQQIVDQLDKLINVVQITELDPKDAQQASRKPMREGSPSSSQRPRALSCRAQVRR